MQSIAAKRPSNGWRALSGKPRGREEEEEWKRERAFR
jgi:hypothetical protein